jgi:hypothetical protein
VPATQRLRENILYLLRARNCIRGESEGLLTSELLCSAIGYNLPILPSHVVSLLDAGSVIRRPV